MRSGVGSARSGSAAETRKRSIAMSPLVSGEIDVEESVAGILRVERHRKQTAFARSADPPRNVQEGPGPTGAPLHDDDAGRTLDHEKARVPGRSGGKQGLVEASLPLKAPSVPPARGNRTLRGCACSSGSPGAPPARWAAAGCPASAAR